MSLAKTWLEAELASGKDRQQATDDLNAATGYNADWVTVHRWINHDRNPRKEVREYMMRIAIAHLIGGITKKQLDLLTESLT